MTLARLGIAFLAGCLLSFNLFASTVEIMGSRSCGKWTEEKRLAKSTKEMNKIPVLITRSWFLGFLSGRADESGRNFLKGTDSDSIFLWLDNYCQANPTMELNKAGDDLARELMQMKGIK
jgi:hypothetical protein